jgi:hypothetical protein
LKLILEATQALSTPSIRRSATQCAATDREELFGKIVIFLPTSFGKEANSRNFAPSEALSLKRYFTVHATGLPFSGVK